MMQWQWNDRTGRLGVVIVDANPRTVIELDADQASELRHTLGAALLERINRDESENQ